MREKLHVLYQIQELEGEVARKTKQLKGHPILAEFNGLKTNYQARKNDIEYLREVLKGEKKKIKKVEMDIQAVSEEIRELKGKLYSGEISSTKELGQYEKKVQSREKEKNGREEELLGLMEDVEMEEERIELLTRQLKQERSVLKEVQARGMHEINRIKNDIEELSGRRDALRSQADSELLSQYQREAGKYQGFFIARVQDSMCGGCRVFLSSSVLSILDNPGVKLKCENCGRILLKG